MNKKERGKRGDWGTKEIAELLLVLIISGFVIFMLIVLFKGNAGRILESIRNFLRFGA